MCYFNDGATIAHMTETVYVLSCREKETRHLGWYEVVKVNETQQRGSASEWTNVMVIIHCTVAPSHKTAQR